MIKVLTSTLSIGNGAYSRALKADGGRGGGSGYK